MPDNLTRRFSPGPARLTLSSSMNIATTFTGTCKPMFSIVILNTQYYKREIIRRKRKTNRILKGTGQNLIWHDKQRIPLSHRTRFHFAHNNSSHVLEFVYDRHPTDGI